MKKISSAYFFSSALFVLPYTYFVATSTETEPQGIALSVEENSASLAMELFGAEVPPQQEIREILENSIQAIQARCRQEDRDIQGEIQMCMYPLSQERYGAPKLACIDNGEGMGPEDLYRFINKIYSSGRITGVSENYGIGAKIAALNANPAGVVYETWKNGQGYRITMRRFEDGSYSSVAVDTPGAIAVEGIKIIEPLPSSEMPFLVRQSGGFGTMVVLLGDNKESNTLQAPKNYSGKKGEWLAWTINSRYFDIPQGIQVNTSTASSRSPKVWTRATGLRSFLQKYKKASGTLSFDDLDIHWYLMKHHKSYRNEKKIFDSGAKVGALHNNELYDYITSVKAQNRLQHYFGVPFGANEVVLIFEPHNAHPTQSRADLKINTESLPWEKWQGLFRNNIPAPIKKHIQEKNQSVVRSGRSISKMLQNLNSYRRQNKRQKSRDGKRIGGDPLHNHKTEGLPVNKTVSHSTTSSVTPSSPGSAQTSSAPVQKTSASLLAPGTKRTARRKSVLFTENDLPQYSWVSNQVFGMGGHFVRYLQIDNQILFNQDFPLYKEVVDKWLGRTEPIWKDNVLEIIQEEFAMQAIEAILGIKDQEGDEGYSSEEVRTLLANEKALSLVATQRTRLEEALSRRLKSYSQKEEK